MIGIQDPCEGMGMGFAAGASCAWQVAEGAERTGIPCANLLCGCTVFFTVSIPCAIIFGVYGIFKGCLSLEIRGCAVVPSGVGCPK